MLPFFSPQNRLIKRAMIAGDILLVFFSLVCAVLIKITLSQELTLDSWLSRSSPWLLLLLTIYPIVFYIFDLYDEELWQKRVTLFVHITVSVITAVVTSTFVFYLVSSDVITGRIIIFLHALFSIIFLFTWRKLFTLFIIDQHHSKSGILFLGNDPILHEIHDTLINKAESGVQYLTWIKEDNPLASLTEATVKKQIRTIVVSGHMKSSPKLRQELLNLRFAGLAIFDAPFFYELLTGKVPVKTLKEVSFVFYNQGQAFNPAFYRRIKRFLDIFLSLSGLIFTLPIIACCSVAIKLSSPGAIFFTQERLGKNETPFTMIKFRTMVENAEKLTGPQWASENDPRITKIGRFLRKSRLDELPQLFNILRGNMSFVGPRPIRKHFADLISKQVPYYRLRFVMKPGLTGWAQVRGGYSGTEEEQIEKLQYDLFYLRNQSIMLDLLIILKTVQTVLFRKGT